MTFKELKDIVENTDTVGGRAFNLAIQVLIFVSLVTFSIDTLPDLSATARKVLYGLEAVTVAIFTLEYILRIYVADDRRRFIFSFLGFVDLIAILPFYVAHGVDLRSVRLLRIFRVFRILKLVRYNQAIDRFRAAFMEVREELIVYLVATAVILFLASVGIYYFENEAQPDKFASIFHAMWWALATLTTVGYGDVYPVTVGGKVFTGVLLIVVLGLVAVPSGIVASALTKVRRRE